MQPATMLPSNRMWIDSSGTPLVSGTQKMTHTPMMMQQDPNSKNVPYVISLSMMGVSLAMRKLKSHCVMSAAAMISDRTWFGAHSDDRMKGVGPQPNE